MREAVRIFVSYTCESFRVCDSERAKIVSVEFVVYSQIFKKKCSKNVTSRWRRELFIRKGVQ